MKSFRRLPLFPVLLLIATACNQGSDPAAEGSATEDSAYCTCLKEAANHYMQLGYKADKEDILLFCEKHEEGASGLSDVQKRAFGECFEIVMNNIENKELFKELHNGNSVFDTMNICAKDFLDEFINNGGFDTKNQLNREYFTVKGERFMEILAEKYENEYNLNDNRDNYEDVGDYVKRYIGVDKVNKIRLKFIMDLVSYKHKGQIFSGKMVVDSVVSNSNGPQGMFAVVGSLYCYGKILDGNSDLQIIIHLPASERNKIIPAIHSIHRQSFGDTPLTQYAQIIKFNSTFRHLKEAANSSLDNFWIGSVEMDALSHNYIYPDRNVDISDYAGKPLFIFPDDGDSGYDAKDSNEKDNVVDMDAETDLVYYRISDPDGYSNLRSQPKGEVIRRVSENETFLVLGSKEGHKLVKLSDGTEGYVHESRVVPAQR